MHANVGSGQAPRPSARVTSRRRLLSTTLGVGAATLLLGEGKAFGIGISPADDTNFQPDTTAMTQAGTSRVSAGMITRQPAAATDSLPGIGRFNSLPLVMSPQSFRTPGAPVTPKAGYDPKRQYHYDVTVQPDGRPLTHIQGQFAVHPTVAGRWIGEQFALYEGTADPKYLQAALKTLKWLYQDAAVVQTARGAARFTRYLFNWPGSDQNPWYSAFGNSVVLEQSLNAWLFTGDRTYIRYADEFFNAYLVPRNAAKPHQPWITKVQDGWLWFDENPQANGEISEAINAEAMDWYGVHMYYGVRREALALRLSYGLFATMDHLCSVVRQPGECSWYDAGHNSAFESYHSVNTGVFATMYTITGHLPYLLAVENLLEDHPIPTTGYPVWVDGGSTFTVRPDSHHVPAPQSWHNPAGGFLTGKDALLRTYKGEGSARWVKLRKGSMGQYWFKVSDHVYQVAKGPQVTDQPEWWGFGSRPPKVLLKPLTKITAFSYDANGRVTRTSTGTWTRGTLVQCLGRARIRGVNHFYIGNGKFAGMWIPMSQGTFVA